MARHLPRAVRAHAAPKCGAGRAVAQLHHPRRRRPVAAAEAGDGGRAGRCQTLGAPGDDGCDPALEGPRADARAHHAGRGHRLRRRSRARRVRRLPGAAGGAERRGFRRPAATCDGDPARPARRAGALSPHVPLHPGGRIPGHQPDPVFVAAAAGAGAPQHLLRRRRRPVDLFLARRGSGEHPALREGFSRCAHRAAGGELPLHRADPGRRLRADRAQRGTPRQDAAARPQRRRGRARGGGRAVGFRRGGAHGRRARRGAAPRRPRACRDGGAGARRLPDPRLRGAADHARPAVPRGRRSALLRAPGNPRRHRVYARAGVAVRRSGVRAHRQRAAPWRRRGGAADAARDGARRWRAAGRGSGEADCHGRAEGPRSGSDRHAAARFRPLARAAGKRRPCHHAGDAAGRERLYGNVAAGQVAGGAGAAGEPEGAGCARWRTSTRWPASSITSRW